MAEPAKVKEAASAVASGLIDSMTPEIIAQVTMELIDRVPKLPMAPLEAVFGDEGEDDEGELLYFECPHCFRELDYDSINILDIELRHISAFECNVEERQLKFDIDLEGNREDFHMQCSHCGLFVGHPPGWTVDWV